jgi:hypothetical protein
MVDPSVLLEELVVSKGEPLDSYLGRRESYRAAGH